MTVLFIQSQKRVGRCGERFVPLASGVDFVKTREQITARFHHVYRTDRPVGFTVAGDSIDQGVSTCVVITTYLGVTIGTRALN